nr:hypothetical protein [Tanacetum cinerariifolium]
MRANKNRGGYQMGLRAKSHGVLGEWNGTAPKTHVNLQLQVQRVRTDNGTEFKNKTLAKFFDEDVGKLKSKGDIGVFVRYSKESAAFRIYNKRSRLEPGLSNLNETEKSSNPSVSQVSETSKKDLEDLFHNFYAEYFDSSKIMKSLTTNVKTLINEEVFHEVSESFQGESSSSSLNDDVHKVQKKCKCYLLNDYEDVGKLKAKRDIGVFVGYSKESASFIIYNKRTRKIHESVNVNFDEISEITSKQFSLEPDLSNLNEMGKSSNPSVLQVLETSKKILEDLFQKIYDEYFDSSKIMKSSTTNVETYNVEIPSNE